MSIRPLALLSLGLLVSGPLAASAAAPLDPALPGVCYATLGNNASSPGALITIDPATGAGTLVGPTGITGALGDPGVPALAIRSTGEMYAMDIGAASTLYRVDATTGAATVVAATALNSPPAIAFDGADVLWAVDNAGKLYTVVDSTGVARLIGSTGAFIKGLAFDPLDGRLWGSDASGGIFTLDVHTGAATLVGNTGLPASPDLHFDVAGHLYGSSGGGVAANNFIAIDKGSGAGSVVGPIGFASVAGMASRLDRIVAVALQAYGARWTGERVEVTWRLVDVGGAVRFEATRTDQAGRVTAVDPATIDEGRRGEYVLADEAFDPGATYRYRVVVFEDERAITSFETSVTVPAAFLSLDQNVPNPFNPITRIPFTIPSPGYVSLQIYDPSGRRVRTLIDGAMGAGPSSALWDGRDDGGSDVAAGVYFCRLATGNRTLAKKLVLVK